MKGDEIVSLPQRLPGNMFTKYKLMRKWMVEIARRFENRGIKIARANSIRNTKSINLLKFCTVVNFRCDVCIYKLTARAQSINWEAYDKGCIYDYNVH